jgi:putative tryptophan/tyrosine transport system substrate-binding protein
MKVPRRSFLHLAAGAAALAAPHVAGAQTPNTPRRIGYLHPATIDPGSPVMSILQPTWRKLGYVEGETILLRTAQGDITRLPGLVAELLGLKVDVLIMVGPQAVRVARAATAPRGDPLMAWLSTHDEVSEGFFGFLLAHSICEWPSLVITNPRPSFGRS